MSDLLFLISEEGIAVFVIVSLLIGIAVFGRWFATNYTARVDLKYNELMREIAEIKIEVMNNNGKLYSMTEQLIHNQNSIQSDINAIESSLDTLLKFVNKNGKK